jgi:hypothetical protein
MERKMIGLAGCMDFRRGAGRLPHFEPRAPTKLDPCMIAVIPLGRSSRSNTL